MEGTEGGFVRKGEKAFGFGSTEVAAIDLWKRFLLFCPGYAAVVDGS